MPRGRSRALDGALVLAGCLVALVFVVEVTRDVPRVAGTNDIDPHAFVAEIPSDGGRLCQPDVAWAGTGRLELLTGTYGAPGPPLEITLEADGRVLARGEMSGGWKEGTLTVPIRPPPRRDVAAEICLESAGGARVAVAGEHTEPYAVVDGQPQRGRLSLASLTPHDRSFASHAGTIVERYPRGNASWLGAWTVWLIAGLLLGAIVAAGAALRARPPARRGRIPLAALLCAFAALFSGTAWALLIPPFHAPDEISHAGYVQYLAETGELPVERPNTPQYSEEQRELLGALQFVKVIGRSLDKPPMNESEEAQLRATEARELPRVGEGNAATASANPPLYYLLAAPVYHATASGGLLDQLLFLRLLSVLLTVGTVLAVFLFVRELLPSTPWAWTAGALAAAFQPTLAFVGSAVNADSLLFLASALTLLAIARVLRHGLTLRRGLALGGAVAAGLLTKPLFIGLLPAFAVALGLGVLRRGGTVSSRVAPAAASVALAAVPVAVYTVIGAAFFDHPYFPSGTGVTPVTGDPDSPAHTLTRQLSYMWQLFLPRLPFLQDLIPNVPFVHVWFNGLVGNFGWVDYRFRPGVYSVAQVIAAVLAVLAAGGLIIRRDRLPRRWQEIACYLVAVAGILGAIAVQDYRANVTGGLNFQQARYLLPLLALYAGVFALAVRAFGRFAPVAAVALTAAPVVHTVIAMLLTVERYYG